MSRSQSWGLTPREVSQIRLLGWIYEQTAGDYASGIPGVREFADGEELAPKYVEHEARALEQQGLLRFGPTRVGGLGTVYITDAGRRAVEERSQRRADPARRRQACRDAFLAWLDAQPRSNTEMVPVDGFLRDSRSVYEGERFDADEVDSATAYLLDHGMISGIEIEELGGPVRSSITQVGMDCMEASGSVADYINRDDLATGPTFHTHFNAPVSGQVGVGTHINQTQHQGIDGTTLERLLADVRQAAESIDSDEASYLLAYVDTLRAEAVAEQPDPALIQGSSDRLKQIAAKVGNPALSASVSALTTSLLTAFGLG